MTALLIASHDNVTLSKATLRACAATLEMDDAVHVLVAGNGCAGVAQEAAGIKGAGKVLLAEAAHYESFLAEEIAPLAASLASGYSHIVMAADSEGKDIMPRVAALLDVTQVSDITAVLAPDTFRRPIYAGNALETVQSHEKIKVVTVRQSAFDAVATEAAGGAPVERVAALAVSGLSSYVGREQVSGGKVDLPSARIVVSGGRGLGSKENFRLVEELAARLGAAVGASRAAVDAGYISNDAQVGQTGKIVAPELYIAIGISGAIQHVAGMKESKVIVAINKDENAPIFDIADYGLVADLFPAIEELKSAL